MPVIIQAYYHRKSEGKKWGIYKEIRNSLAEGTNAWIGNSRVKINGESTIAPIIRVYAGEIKIDVILEACLSSTYISYCCDRVEKDGAEAVESAKDIARSWRIRWVAESKMHGLEFVSYQAIRWVFITRGDGSAEVVKENRNQLIRID